MNLLVGLDLLPDRDSQRTQRRELDIHVPNIPMILVSFPDDELGLAVLVVCPPNLAAMHPSL